jgi:hypothetical protein
LRIWRCLHANQRAFEEGDPMSVLMFRRKVKKEAVTEVEAAVARMFAAIHEDVPEGVRFAYTMAADGVTIVGFVQLDNPPENPLTAMPAVVEFQKNAEEWVDGPTSSDELTVVGSYRLFE